MIVDINNIISLPITKKPLPEEEKGLKLIEGFQSKCKHMSAAVIVDESLDTCECGICGEKLNPIWVLSELAKKENQWHRSWKSMDDARKKYENRSRTKCVHCHQMTPISRN